MDQEWDDSVAQLHSEAWIAWNASYHEGQGDESRSRGAHLYRQAWHERIVERFRQLDEQNALLEQLLAASPAQKDLAAR